VAVVALNILVIQQRLVVLVVLAVVVVLPKVQRVPVALAQQAKEIMVALAHQQLQEFIGVAVVAELVQLVARVQQLQ
jgi:hypothetical protein